MQLKGSGYFELTQSWTYMAFTGDAVGLVFTVSCYQDEDVFL